MATAAAERAFAFFYEHAGFSWNPKTETKEDGRKRCAETLVKAERDAASLGFGFEWSVDDCDSSEWSDDPEPWAQWVCVCKDENGNVLASLCGIDFGRDGDPWGDPYARVVEAELASEAID